MKRVALAVLMAMSLSVQAQVMGRLPGVLYPADRGLRSSANLQTQVTAVSTVPYTFVLDRGTWTISEDLSIPATVKLQLLPGAVFSISAGINLEILGELDAPEAAIFSGTGTASGPATFPYRHVIWGDLVQFDIGTGYLASYSAFTNEQASVAADIASLTNDVGELRVDLTTLEGTVSNINVDVVGLDGDMSLTTNALAQLNADFGAISNDFVTLEDYLLNETDGLVTVLQTNQATTVENFQNVNVNTEATTNLFSIVGQLLGQEGNTNYTDWVDSFRLMNTDYEALPTNLVFSFPDLFTQYTTNVLTPMVEDAVDFASFVCMITDAVVAQPGGSTFYELGTTAGLDLDQYAAAGTNFNPSTGVFTAPYDGWYLFGLQLRATSASTTSAMWMGVVSNDDTTEGDFWETFWAKPPGGYPTTEHHIAASILVEIAAGTEMSAYLYRSASGGSVTYTALRFFGYLIQKNE